MTEQQNPEAGAERAAPELKNESARRAVTAVWRIESAHIVAALTRSVGDFGIAEDLAQEALVDALEQWPRDGVPRNPAAWLMTVARRKGIDRWRRQARMGEIAHDAQRELAGEGHDDPWDPDTIDDDVLRLMFIACHPVLAPQAQVALTLRVVGGLTSEEIARAFLVSTSTVQQRIVRAKRTLASAKAPFEVPPPAERDKRLAAIFGVLYLIFNEGHAATSGPDWMRPGLAYEAIRITRALTGLTRAEPEVWGLLALMELTAARFPARVDANGGPVLLADQDRARWDRDRIRRGRAALARADGAGRGRGPYALQAAIAQYHAVAPSVEQTDWEQIVILYEALGRVAASPVVELNRAVAVAMCGRPHEALGILDDLETRGVLPRYHLLPATRAEILQRLGRREEARAEFTVAARLAGNDRERALLEAKAAG